jgi:hypothetical protein
VARIKIRKRDDGLLAVRVVPSRPGERQAERTSVVNPEDLERTVAAKLTRIKNPPLEPTEPG